MGRVSNGTEGGETLEAETTEVMVVSRADHFEIEVLGCIPTLSRLPI